MALSGGNNLLGSAKSLGETATVIMAKVDKAKID